MSWNCSVCTFANEPLFLQCAICGTLKTCDAQSDLNTSEWSCSQCTFVNQPSSAECSICRHPCPNSNNNNDNNDKDNDNTDSKSVNETKCDSSNAVTSHDNKKRSRAQFEDECDNDNDDVDGDEDGDFVFNASNHNRKRKKPKLTHVSEAVSDDVTHSNTTTTTSTTNSNSHQPHLDNLNISSSRSHDDDREAKDSMEQDQNNNDNNDAEEEEDVGNQVFPPITKLDEVLHNRTSWRWENDILRRIGANWKKRYAEYTNPVHAKTMRVIVSGIDATRTNGNTSLASLINNQDINRWRHWSLDTGPLDEYGLAIVDDGDGDGDNHSPHLILDFLETAVHLTDYMFTHPLHTNSAYKHIELNAWTIEGSNDLETWSLIQQETRNASNLSYLGGDFDRWRMLGDDGDDDIINRSSRMTFLSHIEDRPPQYYTKLRFTVTSCWNTRYKVPTSQCVLALQRFRLYGQVRRRVYKVARVNEVKKISFASIGGNMIEGDPQKMLNFFNGDQGVQHLECEAFSEEIENFRCELKPYQKQCLSWMLDREDNGNKFGINGGMLCHEMGLGKTVQIIALLLLQRQRKGKERTLILTPLSLIDQWMSEIEKFAGANTFKSINYYGQKRKRITARDFEQCDLIFSSFDTFSRSIGAVHFEYDDYANEDYYMAHEPQLMFKMAPDLFTRIVIDESHEIKKPNSNRAQHISVFAETKKIKYRWCLTGTPFSDDLPVNLSASCYLLGMSRSDFIDALSMSAAEKAQAKDANIISCYQGDNNDNDSSLFYKNGRRKKKKKKASDQIWGHIDDAFYVQHKLRPFLSELMVRRTKQQVSSDDHNFEFPQKREEIVYVELNEDEAVIYNKLATEVTQKYRVYKLSNNVMRHYVYLIQMLTKLRQLCDHPGIVYGSRAADNDGGDAGGDMWNAFAGDVLTKLKADIVRRINEMESIWSYECPVCMETTAENGALLAVCGHLFCLECLKLMIEQNSLCGLCRTECKKKDIIRIEKVLKSEKLDAKHKEEYRQYVEENNDGEHDDERDDDGDDDKSSNKENVDQRKYHEIMLKYTNTEKSSSKMDALLDRMRYINQHHAGDKIIVFSNFSQLFSIISKRLKTENMQHLQFDSTLTRNRRKKVLEQFESSAQHNILLLSTKCASVGLNLMCANHVIFVDPRVNPALDNQAVGRVWRLGQNKTVYVTRLITRNTVEEKMLSLLHDKASTEEGQQNVNLKQNAKLKVEDWDMIFGYSS